MSYFDDFMMEAYLGKTETLIQAEQVLGQLMTLIKQEPLKDWTTHPLNKKLGDLLSQQFGFSSTYVKWIRTARAIPSVYTLFSSDVILYGRKDIEYLGKKKGFYDKGHNHTCYIMASATMVSQLNLTAEELMGILLHEIGHNFDNGPWMTFHQIWALLSQIASIFKVVTYVVPTEDGWEPVRQTVFNPAAIVNIAKTTNSGKEILKFVDDTFERILEWARPLKYFANFFNEIVSWVARFTEIFFSGLSFWITLPLSVILSPVAHLYGLVSRKTEQWADSFAAVYGYGGALGSALSKFSTTNTYSPKNDEFEIRRIGRDFVMMYRALSGVLVGGATHGTIDTRIMSNIQFLEKEVEASGYPASMKADMKQQIAEMKKVYEDYINMSDDQKLTLTSSCRRMLAKMFKGRSDYIAKLFPDNYADIRESVLDKKLEIYEAFKDRLITESERDVLIDTLEDVNCLRVFSE